MDWVASKLLKNYRYLNAKKLGIESKPLVNIAFYFCVLLIIDKY